MEEEKKNGVRSSIVASPQSLPLLPLQPQHARAIPQRNQPGPGVDAQLGAGIGDVEVAHGELADAVRRRERRVVHLFHGEALGRVGQVGACCVEDGVVVAAAQFERDFAGDGAGHLALGSFAQHHGLRVEPAALVEQAAELEGSTGSGLALMQEGSTGSGLALMHTTLRR